MKKHKAFDAVRMKNELQAKLREDQKGLSEDEIERRRREWLETSNDDLAKWWRRVRAHQEAASAEVRENPPDSPS